MVSIEERTTRHDGVTLVHVVVANESSERERVRLEVACDGAVWPPRRRGVPEAGWDADGVVVTVAAGGVRGFGFATPAAPSAVDVTVTATVVRGRVESHGESATAVDDQVGDARSLDGVVRALGDFAPPLAATPREAAARNLRDSTGSDEQGDRRT